MHPVPWPDLRCPPTLPPKRCALVLSMSLLSFARAQLDTRVAAEMVLPDHLSKSADKGLERPAAIQRYITELSTDNKNQTFNTTFAFPSQGGIRNAPVLLLLNGASCESWEYSDFLNELTAAGFVTIVTDLWKKMPAGFPARPGCPKDKAVLVTSLIWDPVLSFTTAIQERARSPDEKALAEALAQADKDSIVLLAHSWGGVIAMELLEGDCSSDDRNQTRGTAQIKGAIIFEGGSRDPVLLKRHQFVAYMSSTISENRSRPYFDKTDGTKDFIVLQDCNHFGINNFHKESKYMVSPCAVPLDKETGHFQTTEARQKEVIATVAQIALLEIKARVMEEEIASAALQDLQKTYKLVEKSIISS